MSSEPLADVIPLLKRPADGAMITQFDYPTCESLGLIKMDFLGLRNLTVLDDALANIEANRGEQVVLEELELTDEATYALLQRRAPPRGGGRPWAPPPARGPPAPARPRPGAPPPLRAPPRGRPPPPPGRGGRPPQKKPPPPQDRPRARRGDPPRAGRAARGDP